MNFPQSVRPPLCTQAAARRRAASQTLTMGAGFGPWGAPVEWRGARAGATRRSFDFIYYCLVLAPKSAGPKFWCPGKTGSIDRYNFPVGSGFVGRFITGSGFCGNSAGFGCDCIIGVLFVFTTPESSLRR